MVPQYLVDPQAAVQDWFEEAPVFRDRISEEWEHAGQVIQGRQLNNLDPPRHTVERRAEQRTFTHGRVDAVKPVIAAIANGLIDELVDRGGCDLMQE